MQTQSAEWYGLMERMSADDAQRVIRLAEERDLLKQFYLDALTSLVRQLYGRGDGEYRQRAMGGDREMFDALIESGRLIMVDEGAYRFVTD